jgi:hypothetical protein
VACSSWFTVNLEPGLSYHQFVQTTRSAPAPNIHIELFALEKGIALPATSQTQKAFDFKFIIHLVGDALQPMKILAAIRSKLPMIINQPS